MITPAGPTVLFQPRGVDGLQAVHERLPRWAVEAFAAVTHLGDPGVLLALAVLAYLASDRRAGGIVAGALFAGFALTIGLKAWFAVPRPPSELQYVTETGFGFPSGHALGATVGWGALAAVLEDLWTRRRRAVAAAVVVVAVSLSRVVVGVHYPVDVVAGVGIGLVVLAIAAGWLREEPFALFVLAAVLAGAAVVLTGGGLESAALLGGCLGTATAWLETERVDRPWTGPGVMAGVVVTALGGIALAGVGPVVALVFGAAALLAAVVVLAPTAGDRWRERARTRAPEE